MKRFDFLILTTAINAVRDTLTPSELDTHAKIVRRLGDEMAAAFQNFDRERFLRDCGLDSISSTHRS